MQIQNKVIAITGAGSGIGRALSLEAAARGAKIAALDWNEASLLETVDLVHQNGSEALAFQGDVSDPATAEALRDATLERFGHVDVLVNNAGIIQPFVQVRHLEPQTLERVINVNFWGVVHMTRAFIPSLEARPEARIVNVSSMGGFCPVPGQAFYGASKAAVKLLTEAMTSELSATSVGVTVVFPGAVATSITANAPDIDPETVKAMGSSSQENAARTTSAEKAAEIILAGIEKGRERVFVGKDSKFLDFLTRLAPIYARKFMAKMLRKAGINV